MTEPKIRFAGVAAVVAAACGTGIVAACLMWMTLAGPDATTGPPPASTTATVTETITATTTTTTATVHHTHATSCPPEPSQDY